MAYQTPFEYSGEELDQAKVDDLLVDIRCAREKYRETNDPGWLIYISQCEEELINMQ